MTATSAPIAAGQPTAGRPPDGLPPNGPPLAPVLPVAEPAAVVVTPAQRRGHARIQIARGLASAATGQLARDLVAIALLAATVIVFFWPLLAEGQVAYENDTRIFYYPLFARLSQAVKSGSLPLWSPQIFTGYPVFADGESGSLYPFHLLAMLFLPVETAFTALRPLRFFQAALFTFLFCRSLGLGRFGAVVGALAFAFSGFAVAQMHQSRWC